MGLESPTLSVFSPKDLELLLLRPQFQVICLEKASIWLI